MYNGWTNGRTNGCTMDEPMDELMCVQWGIESINIYIYDQWMTLY